MNKVQILLISLVGLLLMGLIYTFGRLAYPNMSGDAISFGPPAITYARTGTLDVQLSTYFFPSVFTDFLGSINSGGRYIWYPPFFYLAVGSLLAEGSAVGFFIIIGTIGASVFLLGITAVVMSVRTSSETRFGSLVIILSMFTLAHYITGSQNGRPEIFAAFFITLGILLAEVQQKHLIWIWGLILGVLCATHIIACLISLAIAGLFFSAKYSPKQLFGAMLGIMAVAIPTATILFLLSPNGLLDTVRGTLYHAQLIGGRVVIEPFLSYYVLNVRAMFVGILMIISLILSALWSLISRYKIKSPLIHIFFWILLIFVVVYAGVRNVQNYYNLMPFTPLVVVIIVRSYYYYSKQNRGFRKLLAKILIFIILLIPSIGLLRDAVLFALYLEKGLSLINARELFQDLQIPDGANVGISGSTWALSEDYHKMTMYNPQNRLVDIIIFQQNGSGLQDPPEISDYSVKHNYFVAGPDGILRFLANTTPGYAFAVYYRTVCVKGFETTSVKKIKADSAVVWAD